MTARSRDADLGTAAFVQLRALLRHEAEAIDLCRPGEVVDIIGLGQVTASRDPAGS